MGLPQEILDFDPLINSTMVLDSITEDGVRLCTIEADYPRFVHSELLTHRMFGRNSASSRAISWTVMRENIEKRPVVPVRFGEEKKGMATGAYLTGDNDAEARDIWLDARDAALLHAQELADLGVHKSLCNRITEPYMRIRVVITATDWEGFFMQRVHGDAEIHMQIIAEHMQKVITESKPTLLKPGQWHLPYIDEAVWYGSEPYPAIYDENKTSYDARLISTARAAGVSYLKRGTGTLQKDYDLSQKLKLGSGFGHRSPFEHVAQAKSADYRSGPLRGYRQFRKVVFQEGHDGVQTRLHDVSVARG